MNSTIEKTIRPATAELRQAELPTTQARRVSVRLIVVVLTIAANLALLEIGLRVTGRYKLDSTDGYFAPEGISYGLKKNVSKRVYWPRQSFLVETDEFGNRANKSGRRDLIGKRYYAVLGASDAFGNGLDYDKTFIGIFAERMKARDTEVVDLAVGGHHLKEQVARLEGFVSQVPTSPRAVIIVFTPLMIATFDETNEGILVINGELFERNSWRVALLKRTLANSSAAYCFFRDKIRNIQLRHFNRASLSVDYYLQYYSTSLPIRTPAKLADFEERIVDLDKRIGSMGATPIYVYSPPSGGLMVKQLIHEGKVDASRFDTEFYRDLLRKHCAAAGIEFVDLEPMLQERYDHGEKVSFDLDAHFNEATSKAVGEYLYLSLNPEPRFSVVRSARRSQIQVR
jgi:hypothetical protein